ncbi:hypothetical protein NPIL_93291 [Nephila pilipes]|uniref:Uncharacterized protein n=1 Tax=Nephila pilipes TaxID=299642 RepID=A0A8X6NFA3_NEPPI|nr:hypothetical protein NPIL_93291 [Nephila pilipes]
MQQAVSCFERFSTQTCSADCPKTQQRSIDRLKACTVGKMTFRWQTSPHDLEQRFTPLRQSCTNRFSVQPKVSHSELIDHALSWIFASKHQNSYPSCSYHALGP